MAKQKNSLVNNINKRKKAGTSRSKAESTISQESYRNMKDGWPKKKTAKKNATKKKAAKKKTPAKKQTKKKTSSGRRRTK